MITMFAQKLHSDLKIIRHLLHGDHHVLFPNIHRRNDCWQKASKDNFETSVHLIFWLDCREWIDASVHNLPVVCNYTVITQ